jgi:hypothetical protein
VSDFLLVVFFAVGVPSAKSLANGKREMSQPLLTNKKQGKKPTENNPLTLLSQPSFAFRRRRRRIFILFVYVEKYVYFYGKSEVSLENLKTDRDSYLA